MRPMRRVVLLVYALIFASSAVYMALVPLAPSFAARFSLSEIEIGAVLGCSTLATVLVAGPAGMLADRFGARRLTIWAAAVLVASCLGQATAVDFWSLAASRLVLGVANGMIWTAGLAWLLAVTSGTRRASVLGATISVSGVGVMIGPVCSGLLAERAGLATPFLVLAGGCGLLAAASLATEERGRSVHSHLPLVDTLRSIRRERVVLGGFVAMILTGLTTGLVNLLVPLQLDRNGISASGIGLALSASTGIFTVGSGLVARLGDRVASLRIAAIAALGLGATFALAVASASTPALVAFVLARAPFWAVLSTIAYPLGTGAAARGEAGVGAVIGLMNLLWGVAAFASPLAGGALAQAIGERWVYTLLLTTCLAVASWMLLGRRAAPVPALRVLVPDREP